ncbi:MAG: SCO family protein, partial [Gemmatimonadota bacterium]
MACGGGSSRGDGEGLPTYWEAPDFELVTQQRDTLTARELRGTVWVGHIFFTNCTGVCPMTTGRMAQVRDSLSAAGLLGEQVRLVSFSVDPARDSVPVLQEWAARYGASSPSNWAFLTGDRPDRIRRMIQQGFKLSAQLPPDTAGGYQVSHSPRVLL